MGGNSSVTCPSGSLAGVRRRSPELDWRVATFAMQNGLIRGKLAFLGDVAALRGPRGLCPRLRCFVRPVHFAWDRSSHQLSFDMS